VRSLKHRKTWIQFAFAWQFLLSPLQTFRVINLFVRGLDRILPVEKLNKLRPSPLASGSAVVLSDGQSGEY